MGIIKAIYLLIRAVLIEKAQELWQELPDEEMIAPLANKAGELSDALEKAQQIRQELP